jgi:NAD-dependent deacetylase
MLAGEKIPRCDSCNGLLKPATVAFGQAMPERETSESQRRSASCDMLLAAGSSMVVYPAAQMPLIAKRSGATMVIINLTPTPHDPQADIVVNAKTGETLAKIMVMVKEKLQA